MLLKFEFLIYDVKYLTFALIRCNQRIAIIALDAAVGIFRITLLTVVNIASCTGNCTFNDIKSVYYDMTIRYMTLRLTDNYQHFRRLLKTHLFNLAFN